MADIKDAQQAHEGPGENHHGHHHEVEISINGKHFKVHSGPNGVKHLKHLAEIPHEDVLGKEGEGKFHPLDQDGEVHIHGGEVFISHKRLVGITINNKPRETHPGKNSVEHLRKLGEVPADEILAEFKHGQFVDLADDGHVEIHGGEVFASHRKSGGSS
jgi:hypothetical protein